MHPALHVCIEMHSFPNLSLSLSLSVSPNAMQVEEAQKRLNKWDDGKAPLLSVQE
jgi:hypothetical protein